MRRILVVTPCPTHPGFEGNARRIFNLVESLRFLGHEIHLLYLPHFMFSRPDVPAMRSYWEDCLHVGQPHLAFLPGFLRKALLIQYETLRARLPRGEARRRASGAAEWDRMTRVDWEEEVERLCAVHRFDTIIVEYVVLSSVLRRIPDSVLKIIDTHDRFSGLEEMADGTPGNRRWLSMSRRDEALGLARAHVVLAIQDREADHFRQLTSNPVITVGHLTGPPKAAPDPPGPPAVLIVGSRIPINARGLAVFLEQVWPLVRMRLPDARLRLAGGLSALDSRAMPGVERLGYVEDISAAYARAHVVVNPSLDGTGLPIKSIEALANGKPLVTTMAGARGLEDASGSALLACQNPNDVASAIIRLLEDGEERRRLAAAAATFVSCWNERQLRNLQLAVSLTTEAQRKALDSGSTCAAQRDPT